jgi:hypothetical protein
MKMLEVLKEIKNKNETNVNKLPILVSSLKDTVNNIGNDWTSKERELYIFNQLSRLDFIKNGEFIKKNKKIIDTIKLVYNSNTPTSFTTMDLNLLYPEVEVDKIYIIQEPFGTKASPDFLFITNKGIFGLEDKSSNNGKISFNTGTPGGNKFIMYYNRKENKIFLLTGEKWGWNNDIENEYKKFTQEMIKNCAIEFRKRFGNKVPKMDYYARPMLVDKNKINDIWHQDEKDVMDMLRKYI